MKKIKLLLLIVLLTIVSVFTVTSSANIPNINLTNIEASKNSTTELGMERIYEDLTQPLRKSVQDEEISYAYSSKFNLNSSRKVIGKVNSVERITHTYKDKNGSCFEYDRKGRIVSLKNELTEPNNQKVTYADGLIKKVNQKMDKLVYGYDKFSIINFSEDEFGFQMFLSQNVGNVGKDYICISLDCYGELSWFTVYYSDIDSITDEEIAYFEEEINNYVSKNYLYKEYKHDVNYNIIENALIATYTINFTTNDNMCYTDIISVGQVR